LTYERIGLSERSKGGAPRLKLPRAPRKVNPALTTTVSIMFAILPPLIKLHITISIDASDSTTIITKNSAISTNTSATATATDATISETNIAIATADDTAN